VIERRRLQRTRVAQPAKVLAEDADVGHDCTVENLNTLGACIFFDAATYADWLRAAGLEIIEQEFVPEDDGGHALFWARLGGNGP